jgi:PDZ domain-containing protein
MLTFDDDVRTYSTSGSLNFTTVSVTRADAKVSLLQALSSFFSPDDAVVPKSAVYPHNETAKEATQQSAAQLASSKDASRVAALRAAGYTVRESTRVASVADDGPAHGKIKADDVIVAVDGRKVTTSVSAVKAISGHKPGDEVQIQVRRGGATRTLAITTRADEQDAKVARIGVTVAPRYSFPFEVNNNIGDQIGGPSAGSMFALAIYDKLTPGDLTGGASIAGTGEITADGTIGPIGGVQQKIAGAKAAGATLFLVPADNCAEARKSDGIQLVKTTTLDDAISSLESLAKNPKAKVPTCS